MAKEPKADIIPHKEILFRDERVDNYHWLRDKNWPNVSNKKIIQYLEEENQYSDQFFTQDPKLQKRLYNEFIGRIKLSDTSTPIKKMSYFYYTKTYSTKEYSSHHRIDDKNNKQLILDENKEAGRSEFFQLGSMSMHPSEQLLAYSVDLKGDEFYSIKIRNIKTKKNLTDEITNTIGKPVWDREGEGFYYVKLDSKWRANKVFYHKVGDNPSQDTEIFYEDDTTFRLSIFKTTDLEKIIIISSSSNSQEAIEVEDLKTKILIKRIKDHLFDIDHFNGYFYLITNDKGRNFRLVKSTDENIGIPRKYEEIIPHSKKDYIIDSIYFDSHFVVTKKVNGISRFFIFNYKNNCEHEINFDEDAYSASSIPSWPDDNGIIIKYSSLRTPNTTYKFLFKEKTLTTLKTQEIPSGYDKRLYTTERIFIKSRDQKTQIPVSLLYKKSLFKGDSSNPLLLYGYGSYGISSPAYFNSNILSLVDRGFVYAIAHIRGGDDLGFEWYESAKFLNKKRTFEDFNDVIKYFADSKYTSKKKISIMGGSAGGMLVGASLNDMSEYLNSAISVVPFVDVLNTMLDDSLPLTPGEFKEWGNPKEKEYYYYIKSYSPYDNIKKQNYPNTYVLAGLNDPRVTYWEPAKYVAKLRAHKKDDNILLLETKMHAGHQGKTGRFEAYKETAKKYYFLLNSHKIQR